jgi:hypothetical protein
LASCQRVYNRGFEPALKRPFIRLSGLAGVMAGALPGKGAVLALAGAIAAVLDGGTMRLLSESEALPSPSRRCPGRHKPDYDKALTVHDNRLTRA